MTDFVQSSETKRAVRKLTNPIADVAGFNAIVQSVITANPFGCVAYMTAGENHSAVEKTREAYTVRILYQDDDAKKVFWAVFVAMAGLVLARVLDPATAQQVVGVITGIGG
jgi:hypothetical protein